MIHKLLAKSLRRFATCLLVDNNFCGKLASPLELPISARVSRIIFDSKQKISMCCQCHHVDVILTLGQRHVFNWLQFIANCYNFILKNNAKNLLKIRPLKILTFCAAFSSKRLALWTCCILCSPSFIFCLLRCKKYWINFSLHPLR